MNEPNIMIISKSIAEKYSIHTSRMIVKIGAWNREMVVKVDYQMKADTIALPREISETFTFPLNLPYELVVRDRTLSIGPVIAYVAYRNKDQIRPEKLDSFKSRFANYSQIKGLIFICASNGINPENKTIEGYFYNPKGNNAKSRWIKGVFPYPDVVYKKKPIDTYRYQDLISTIGDRIINSFFFLKAHIQEMAERDPQFRKYFPHTELLKDSKQLKEMIAKYGFIYFKPSNGRQGQGIYKVTIDEKGVYHFLNRKKKTTTYADGVKLTNFLNRCKAKDYIIQQGIQSVLLNRSADFRVYAQKNANQQWVCQGMVGRLSKQGSIVTNLYYLDQLLPDKEAVKAIFRVDDVQASEIQNKIYNHCIEACKMLDKKIGTYGDVAIDIIVDANHQPWILEINKDFGYQSLRKLKKYKLLQKLYTTPFEYAKTLAGFQ